MMRHLLTIISALFALTISPLHAQQSDSAEIVVNRFFNLANYDALPHDKMLFIKSCATSSLGDSVTLMRWYAWPNSYRIELWHADTIVEAYHNDEARLYRKYDIPSMDWIDASPMHYYDMTLGYDFRGSLYHRNSNGSTLRYDGIKLFNGNEVYAISVSAPDMFDRTYFFERHSGLLFLYIEKETHFGDDEMRAENRVDWRSFEEYLPIGQSLIISTESYQSNGVRTYVKHQPTLLPMDRTIFTHDRPKAAYRKKH